jgi:hypothetical protein
MAGPQPVVPLTNARFAPMLRQTPLGQPVSALYGTDAG